MNDKTTGMTFAALMAQACNRRNTATQIRIAFMGLDAAGYGENRLRAMACSLTWYGPGLVFKHYPTEEQRAEFKAAFPDGWHGPGVPSYSALPPSWRADMVRRTQVYRRA